MELIGSGLREACDLLLKADPQVLDAAARSLWISTVAILIATGIGLPTGILLARRPFPGRDALVLAFRGAMSLPTVFIGLVCYAVFSRRGPLGPLELLYTPWVIVCGELLLALPLIVSLCHGAVRSLDPRVAETMQTLGAGWFRRCRTYISEARVGITLAILTAFSRCVTELGVAMMVGGNLRDRTRTLTTATALETGKGEFGRGIAMGLILSGIAVGVTLFIVLLSREEPADG